MVIIWTPLYSKGIFVTLVPMGIIKTCMPTPINQQKLIFWVVGVFFIHAKRFFDIFYEWLFQQGMIAGVGTITTGTKYSARREPFPEAVPFPGAIPSLKAVPFFEAVPSSEAALFPEAIPSLEAVTPLKWYPPLKWSHPLHSEAST